MREASKRVLGLRPFDVQLIGSIIIMHVVGCIEFLSFDSILFKSCDRLLTTLELLIFGEP